MSTNNPMTDEAQVRQLIANWAAAVRARDIEAISANHTPDMLLFDVPPPIQARGLDAYRTSWEFFFAWFGESASLELKELAVTAGTDVAFGHGLIHYSGAEANDNQVKFVSRLTVCCRKLDGQWTIVHEHHSEPSQLT